MSVAIPFDASHDSTGPLASGMASGTSVEQAAISTDSGAGNLSSAVTTVRSMSLATTTATQLAITTQPPSSVKTAAGFSLTVTAEGANGSVDTDYSGHITLSLAANPGSGMLGGTLTAQAVHGVATFTGLTLNKSASGYLIKASASGLSSATSSAIAVTPAATQLAITSQPTSVKTAAVFSLTVTAKDANGNLDPNYAGLVTLSLAANPGNGMLGGTLTAQAVHGVATFTGLTLNKSASGYLIKASASGLTVATSTAIAVTPVATHLAITVPSTSPRTLLQFVVTVNALDDKGNVDPNYSGPITLSLATNPGNATLRGVLTVQAVHGVATFQVSLDRAASGYQFKATASGLTAATSSALTVIPYQLAASASWDGSNTGTSLRTMVPFSVTVRALDAYGDLATNYSGPVTLSLDKNPSNGTLGGTLTAQMVNGVATFTGLTLNKAGKYSIQATATGLPPKDVVISVLTAATHLGITTQPPTSMTQNEDSFTLVAMALDANGNLDPNFSGLVTAMLSANPGNAQLYQPGVDPPGDGEGRVSVMAVNGVATFTGLSVTRPGVGLTILVSGGGLPSVSSTPFTVLSTSTQLAITAPPPNYVKTGTGFSLTVTAKDVHGNPDPNYMGPVTLSLAANPGNGMLAGTLTVNAIHGVATFGGLTLNKPGSGYLIKASAPGLTSATSSAINVLTAAPQLAITTQPPSSVKPGVAFSLTAKALDANGAFDPNYSGLVRVSLLDNPGGGVLGGTLTVRAVNGIATFAGLSLDKPGSGYTIRVDTTDPMFPATSSAITVTPAAPYLAITTQPPSSVLATTGFSMTVTVKDANGNLVPNYSGPVTLSLVTNPGNGSLSGRTTVAAVNGVATFTGLSLNKAAAGYLIQATASGLASATSSAITVTSAATQLVFTSQPNFVYGGFGLSVTALDANGKVDSTYSGPITLSLAANPGNGMLGGTLTVWAVHGVANFRNLSLNKLGDSYLIKATAPGLTSVTSAAIDVILPSDRLAFTTQPPSTVTIGAAFSLTVSAKNSGGFVDPNYSGIVTVSLAANPGAGMLSGTLSVKAVNGVAIFTNLYLNKPGVGYLIKVTAQEQTMSTSSAITATTA